MISLEAAGIVVTQCDGVEPNPGITAVGRGAQITRDEDCDIITHVTEGDFTGVDGTPIQDRFAEGVIINAME